MSKLNGNRDLVHVVDDEDSVRRSLDFLLQAAGYDVMRWANGEEFLKRADNSTPASVLLDVRMPGMSGLEVQEAMSGEGYDFPVIMLSGHGDIDMATRAMRMGAIDFLIKPFDRDKLLRSVADGFRRLSNREALRDRTEWAMAQLGKLTEREREVLDGLACGYPNKTIAYDLGISSRTVEVYRANVMAKLEAGNFADALRIAFAAGLGSDQNWRSAHGLNQRAM